MQVLKDSKGILVSAVGVYLLTYNWKKKKKPASCWFYNCQTSFAGKGVWAPFFSPFMWFHKYGGSVWATIITGAQFPVHALKALWSCPLCVFVLGQHLWSTSFCDLLINPWGTLSGSKLHPLLLPFCWSGRCVCEVPAQVHSSFFERSPFGCQLPLLTSALLYTQFNSLTIPESIWVTASHCPSLLPAPGVTRLLTFSGTVPAGNHHSSRGTLPAVCHLLPFYPLSHYPSRSLLAQTWHGFETPPLHSGRGGSCSMTITDPAILQCSCCSHSLQSMSQGHSH